MIKDNLIFIGLFIGTIFLILSTFYYPGGSNEDLSSIGYDWMHNYISNLLRPEAVNGEANKARPIALTGVLFLTASFGLFFVTFSQRIRIKSASRIIKYLGILVTIFGFIIVIPSLHDLMVTLSSILTLLIFFYITVMVIKSKLTMLKIFSVFFLGTFYLAAYMYFTRSYLEYMPIVQKIIFLIKIFWVLSLEYFSSKEDFQFVTK